MMRCLRLDPKAKKKPAKAANSNTYRNLLLSLSVDPTLSNLLKL